MYRKAQESISLLEVDVPFGTIETEVHTIFIKSVVYMKQRKTKQNRLQAGVGH